MSYVHDGERLYVVDYVNTNIAFLEVVSNGKDNGELVTLPVKEFFRMEVIKSASGHQDGEARTPASSESG